MIEKFIEYCERNHGKISENDSPAHTKIVNEVFSNPYLLSFPEQKKYREVSFGLKRLWHSGFY